MRASFTLPVGVRLLYRTRLRPAIGIVVESNQVSIKNYGRPNEESVTVTSQVVIQGLFSTS